MSLSVYILLYLAQSLFWKWILSWGGAAWLEGWKAFWFVDWFAGRWNTEGLRLYALCMWIVTTIGFLIGLFFPELRGASQL